MLLTAVLIFVYPLLARSASPIAVSVPAVPSFHYAVTSNFLGISIELSFLDTYFGNDTSSIPPTMVNYLQEIRARTGSQVVQMRIGGNSAEDSTFVPSQTSPMVVLTDPNANSNDQPVNYGPQVWDAMHNVSQSAGGVNYLIGLSLNNTDANTLAAAAAYATLGDNLKAAMVGNEPDLFTAHGERPGLKNYTVQDYIGEFSAIVGSLESTSTGDLVASPTLAGPTICCEWDLATLLQQGYLSTFDNVLKYVTLQHYPQDNCGTSYQFGLSYYMQHANVVGLAAWQKPGIEMLVSNTSVNAPKLVLSEFNSASCGGIPGISDTFGASLWTVDYALQLASVGYTAAYIHTREPGISYNLVTPGADLIHDPWRTNPPFYSVVAMAEILQSENGVNVVDLNIEGSMSNTNIPVGGYAIYDASNSTVTRTVLFNFGNSSTQFSLPASKVTGQSATVKYLSSSSATENLTIAWGGETYLGVGNGKAVPAPSGSSWAQPNTQLDCSQGCVVNVPGPSMAVVFYTNVEVNLVSSSNSSNSTSSNSTNNQSPQNAAPQNNSAVVLSLGLQMGVWLAISTGLLLLTDLV